MKSGFIAILGRPNVGKSTLLNAMLEKKISIISPKPQTTRNAIKGIYTSENSQMIFIDTPGIHKPNTTLGETMNKEAFSSSRDVEAIVLIVDASLPFGEGDQFIIDRIDKKTPLFVLFNKIDLCTLPQVLELKEVYAEGKIYLNDEDRVEVNVSITGTMVLPCSITLEPVEYPFSVNVEDDFLDLLEEITENTKKIENSIDLSPIIWENILMEIPMKVTSENAKNISLEGNGWKFVTDEES